MDEDDKLVADNKTGAASGAIHEQDVSVSCCLVCHKYDLTSWSNLNCNRFAGTALAN